MTLKEIIKKRSKLRDYISALNKEYNEAQKERAFTVNTLIEGSSIEEAIDEAYRKYHELQQKLVELNKKNEIALAVSEKLQELYQQKIAERRKLENQIQWLRGQIRLQEQFLMRLQHLQLPDRVSEAKKEEQIRIVNEQIEDLTRKLEEAQKKLNEWKEVNENE